MPDVAPTFLEFGTDRIYGATHQYGDEDRGIAQREYLGFSDDDQANAAETLMDYLSELMEG
ncbi:phage virion morphogenesis protein [Chromohalobacter moromii]|uniref:Phage virion morphogenesis protein n=1 Tax=Chromohalobacter moromii TaxID=2860329 RepID=A0A9X2X2Q9_9GAMM|nr:phage virion morphogenesis protein [Chromohalobacter moromii]MCT8505401.1 phage virion morphogenesis protein [Chromohalobacter moromii]